MHTQHGTALIQDRLPDCRCHWGRLQNSRIFGECGRPERKAVWIDRTGNFRKGLFCSLPYWGYFFVTAGDIQITSRIYLLIKFNNANCALPLGCKLICPAILSLDSKHFDIKQQAEIRLRSHALHFTEIIGLPS